MANCTRTGCHVWLEPYREWLYGDAFEVSPFNTTDRSAIDNVNRMLNQKHDDWRDGLGKLVTNVAYFKIVARSFEPINGLTVKHYTVREFEEFIGARGDEVGKVDSPFAILITNQFVNHGYHGVPIV